MRGFCLSFGVCRRGLAILRGLMLGFGGIARVLALGRRALANLRVAARVCLSFGEFALMAAFPRGFWRALVRPCRICAVFAWLLAVGVGIWRISALSRGSCLSFGGCRRALSVSSGLLPDFGGFKRVCAGGREFGETGTKCVGCRAVRGETRKSGSNGGCFCPFLGE